jgi:DNA polymerase-3 subunit gamma/tau
LVSALNVLNETEIHYKAARNKRLHVELALIRLSYLQQAVTLSNDSQGISKKKLVDTAKPVAFRKIPLMEAAPEPRAKKDAFKKEAEPVEVKPKLIIEEAAEPKSSEASGVAAMMPGVDLNLTGTPAAPPPATKKPVAAKAAKLGSLEHIRQQFANSQGDSESNKIVPLTDELLKQHWEGYTNLLRQKKNPAVQSFDLARLTITSESSFEVVSNNNLEQRFIEQERRFLSDFLQEKFNNRSLNYSIAVSETPMHYVEVEKSLNKKEQFLLIVEQYPIIRELKDRLKLELDY